VTDQQDVLSLRLARYGVPAVILVFYLTAVLRFDYTPEHTFVALGQVTGLPSSPDGSFVSPLWTALIGGARSAGIDPLLAAKVLSLLSTSVALLAAFLIAIEILRDRFLAFAVVLMIAVESWLTQAAVSGHPFAFGMALLLGSVFFLQRNEYPVSAILAGCASLVFWQALFLLPLLAVDAFVNATEQGRRVARAARVLGAGAAVAVLWPVAALITGQGVLSWMPPFPELVVPTVPGWIVYGLCSAALIAGFTILLLKGGGGGRVVLVLLPALGPLVILAACSLSSGDELWRMALPFLFATALFGVRQVLGQLDRSAMLYPVTFLLAGLTLLLNQTEMQPTVRDHMVATAAEDRELEGLAVWVRSHAGPEVRVFSDRPAILMYYAGRDVRAGTPHAPAVTDLVVTARTPGPEFTAVYRLPSSPDVPEIPGGGYVVWRKE
jgi:hypothetical protein